MTDILVLPTDQQDIYLRQLSTETDDTAYFEAVKASRDHLSQFDDNTAEKYQTIEDVRRSRLQAGERLRMGIWRNDTFLGTINASPEEEQVEIGYWIDVRHTGNGYATLAAKAMATYLHPIYPRVFAEVDEANEASIHVLQKAGFHRAAKSVGSLILEYEGA